ncbi:MAG: ParB/RepB/Spo0J family partition protein [Acidobacteria bacterium]|nr:ParB/RepB/Spo0J family partition protein [Acidobacteriota bacterium]
MSGPKRGLPPKRRMRHDSHFVEELAQRAGEGIGRMIPAELITSNHDQPRAALGDLADLVASITRHGILEPLLVRRRTEGHGYELIAGERRFHAALEVGLQEVPCLLVEATDREALEIALIENLQRKDLSPFEEAEGFQTLIDKYHYTHEQVATALGRSRVTVTETLHLLRIPDSLRTRCRHADITAKGLLLEIAKAADHEAMAALVEQLASGQLNRGSLRELRRALSADHASTAEGDTEGASDSPEAQQSAPPRPFVMRFKNPSRSFSVSLSFRTAREPEPRDIVAALEELLAELRQQLQ